MSYNIEYSGRFKKDFKLLKKRGVNINLLYEAISILKEKGSLPKIYRSHMLVSNYKGYWECHIEPNWLMIWKTSGDTIYLVRTGTHSDLFK